MCVMFVDLETVAIFEEIFSLFVGGAHTVVVCLFAHYWEVGQIY